MNELPRFKRGDSQKFFDKLPKKEKDIIDSFIKYVSITSNSKSRQENSKRSIVAFRKSVGVSFDKMTLNHLRNFLASLNSSNRTQATKNELKHSTKRFLKWHFKDWSKRFDNLSDIKLIMRMNEEKINADTLLKKEDIEKIMKTETNFFWKTFFIILYESGLRPIETRTLRWKNIRLNTEGDISEINIYATKTSRARSVYVKEATKYLKEWKERQQLQGVKNDLLFPAKRNPDKPMDKNVVAEWMRRISKRVLKRQINPYLLRHSRATELYCNTNIPDKAVQKFLGHSKSMGDVYTHLSNKDVKDAVMKSIYNLEDLPKEKKHKLEQEIEMLKESMKKIEKRRTAADELITELASNPKTKKMIPQAISKLGLVRKLENLYTDK